MPTKTYSSRSNCIRAARQALGKSTKEGEDFTLSAADGAWSFHPRAKAASAPHGGDSKKALVLALLHRQGGASGAEIATATGWQAHTIRGFIAGTAKGKMGLAVTSERTPERGTVYRIAAVAAE